MKAKGGRTHDSSEVAEPAAEPADVTVEIKIPKELDPAAATTGSVSVDLVPATTTEDVLRALVDNPRPATTFRFSQQLGLHTGRCGRSCDGAAGQR